MSKNRGDWHTVKAEFYKKNKQRTVKKPKKEPKKSKIIQNNVHTSVKKMPRDGRKLENKYTQKNQQRTLKNHKRRAKKPKMKRKKT